jgi:hypothetical protein
MVQALSGQTVCGTVIALVMGVFIKQKNNLTMKYLYGPALCLFSVGVFAQQKPDQYVLIICSKADIKASPEIIKTNIQYWITWMTDLGEHGKMPVH